MTSRGPREAPATIHSGDRVNLSRPFVERPIGTVLLTAGVALAGIAGFFALPVASLPPIELPVISVNAAIPGASPQTMATSVATPLERHLGIIAGVNEITSTSALGATRVTLRAPSGVERESIGVSMSTKPSP